MESKPTPRDMARALGISTARLESMMRAHDAERRDRAQHSATGTVAARLTVAQVEAIARLAREASA